MTTTDAEADKQEYAEFWSALLTRCTALRDGSRLLAAHLHEALAALNAVADEVDDTHPACASVLRDERTRLLRTASVLLNYGDTADELVRTFVAVDVPEFREAS